MNPAPPVHHHLIERNLESTLFLLELPSSSANIFQNRGEISGLFSGRANLGQRDGKGHVIPLGGIREESSHILEKTVAQWQSYTLAALGKRHEEKFRVFNLLCRYWILELDVEVLLTLKGPYGKDATVFHGFYCVENEIDKNLGQYIGICIDLRQIGVKF